MIKELLQKAWYRLARFICVTSVHMAYRIRVYGKQNVPKDGPVLILSNHQSFFDPIFCQSTVKRSFHFVARDSLFRVKFFGSMIRPLHTIPIRRGQADIAAMKRIIAELKQNHPMCLFPEATRTADGKIADIKPGFGLLSRRSGAKVVPMVIEGAFEAWPRHKKFPSIGGQIAVCYGEPITPERIRELGDKEFAAFLTSRLRKMQNECRLKLGKKPFDYPNIDSEQILESTAE